MDFNFVIGVFGLFLLLLGFVMNLLKKLNQESLFYNIVNLGGGQAF